MGKRKFDTIRANEILVNSITVRKLIIENDFIGYNPDGSKKQIETEEEHLNNYNRSSRNTITVDSDNDLDINKNTSYRGKIYFSNNSGSKEKVVTRYEDYNASTDNYDNEIRELRNQIEILQGQILNKGSNFDINEQMIVSFDRKKKQMMECLENNLKDQKLKEFIEKKRMGLSEGKLWELFGESVESATDNNTI